jgi:hypothetical protein
MMQRFDRTINVPPGSGLDEQAYRAFLVQARDVLVRYPQYFAASEDINTLELAHLIPHVPETIIAIYTGINDAVCNKGIVSPFLIRHAHHPVLAFDPEVWPGGAAVPSGTIDVRDVLADFEPPNATWPREWTYVMIIEDARPMEAVWRERGYIDLLPAKLEDFTLLNDARLSRVCVFVDAAVFDHPVNRARAYLKAARNRGQQMASDFAIPAGLEGEMRGLEPLVLYQGEKLYIAKPGGGAAAHGWSNLHPDNQEWAVMNENSAVPLDLIIKRPVVSAGSIPHRAPVTGSADRTTDWFFRGKLVSRAPLLQGAIKG